MNYYENKIFMFTFIRHRIMQLQFDQCAKAVSNK